MKMMFRSVVIGGLALGLSLPSSAAQQTLDERVQRLERMANNPVLMQLSRRLGEQQREIQTLHDEIDRLNHRLKKAEGKLAKQYKESDDRISELETELKALKGGETSAVLIPTETTVPADATEAKTADKPTEKSADQTKSDEKSDGAGNGKATPSAEVTVVPPVVVPEAKADSGKAKPAETDKTLKTPVNKPIKTRAATAEEQAQYKAAFALMKKSKYKEASKGFAELRQKHPESRLASNASYWQGEAEMVIGNKQKGLDAFKDVFQTYPKSTKAAPAMLRAADTLREMNKPDAAKSLYEVLIKDYPKDKVTAKAKKRLAALKAAEKK